MFGTKKRQDRRQGAFYESMFESVDNKAKR